MNANKENKENEDIKAAIADLRAEQKVLLDGVLELDGRVGALRDQCQHVPGPSGWCANCGRWL